MVRSFDFLELFGADLHEHVTLFHIPVSFLGGKLATASVVTEEPDTGKVASNISLRMKNGAKSLVNGKTGPSQALPHSTSLNKNYYSLTQADEGLLSMFSLFASHTTTVLLVVHLVALCCPLIDVHNRK